MATPTAKIGATLRALVRWLTGEAPPGGGRSIEWRDVPIEGRVSPARMLVESFDADRFRVGLRPTYDQGMRPVAVLYVWEEGHRAIGGRTRIPLARLTPEVRESLAAEFRAMPAPPIALLLRHVAAPDGDPVECYARRAPAEGGVWLYHPETRQGAPGAFAWFEADAREGMAPPALIGTWYPVERLRPAEVSEVVRAHFRLALTVIE